MIETQPSTDNAALFRARSGDVFARIAHRYDFLCDVFSIYAHRFWKEAMAREIALNAEGVILDVASGTGDIPLRLLKRLRKKSPYISNLTVIVTDICPEMLAVARQKIGAPDTTLTFAHADVHNLKDFGDATIDVFSISFAMKICDRSLVLKEAARVLKPGGKFYCLEASIIPNKIIHSAYLIYMDWCLPIIARFASGGDRDAYDYLLRGIHNFPTQQVFSKEIEDAGFTSVSFKNFSFGIVALHGAVRKS